MAGNSKRKGAVRKPGSKKTAQVGSGGKGRRALEGRGPTPKAEDRPYHAAHKRKKAAEATADKGGQQRGQRSGAPVDVIAGRNSVVEALRAGLKADALYVFAKVDADERVSEALSTALDLEIPIREVAKQELDVLTGGASHQGLVLAVAEYDYAAPEDLLEADGVPLIIALDSIQDPRNLGAIIRSAAAFGATGVLIPERRAAAVTASAWKTSAGAAARIPVARAVNLTRALENYKKERVFVVGLAADGDVPIGNCDLLQEPVVIVVGSEGQGLTRLVRETCDQIASIPISASTESLNASVAASVALYEATRARG